MRLCTIKLVCLKLWWTVCAAAGLLILLLGSFAFYEDTQAVAAAKEKQRAYADWQAAEANRPADEWEQYRKKPEPPPPPGLIPSSQSGQIVRFTVFAEIALGFLCCLGNWWIAWMFEVPPAKPLVATRINPLSRQVTYLQEDQSPTTTSATQLASRTGASESSVIAAIRSGKLKGYERDGTWYVSERLPPT